MSEPNALVQFRLDADRPLKLRWLGLANDGVPGDGYKPQITAVRLGDGLRLHIDASAILEHIAPDAGGGEGAFVLTFNGVIGYPANHPERARIDKLGDSAQEIDYDVELVHEASGRIAIPGEDYEIVERPRARAHKLPAAAR